MVLRTVALFLCILFGTTTLAQDAGDEGSYLEQLIESSLSGDGRDVSVSGFSGALSSTAQLDRLTISDRDGVWLILEDAQLDWTRSALLRGALEVETLRAARLEILRAPIPQEGLDLPQAEATPFTFPDLPVSIRIGSLAIHRMTLGTPLLGETVVLGLEGGAFLDETRANVALSLQRFDAGGQFNATLDYDDAAQSIALDLSFQEPDGGLVSRLLNIPGAPSLSLTVQGEGPLADLTTDIRLRTNNQDRLAGTVILTGTQDAGHGFNANLSGDVTALFAPQYSAFFGPDVGLSASGTRDASGALSLSRLRLDARAVSLGGRIDLNPSGWPTRLNIRGRIADADTNGKPVLLPLPGIDTRIDTADFLVTFDAAQGDAIVARASVSGLQREDMSADRILVGFDGNISDPQQGPETAAAWMRGKLSAGASGLDLGASDLDGIIGDQTRLSTSIDLRQGESLSLQEFTLAGPGYALRGDAKVTGFDTDADVAFDVSFAADDLNRFSGIAGQPLGGSLDMSASGRATPLDGSFDIKLTGQAMDLTTGQDQIDALTRGNSEIAVRARRGTEGLFIDRFEMTSSEFSAKVQGAVASRNSQLDYAVRINDVARLIPDHTGALAASGTLSRDSSGAWNTASKFDAPYGTTAELLGTLTGSDAAVTLEASLPDISPLVPDLSGPVQVSARADRANGGWSVQLDTSGAGGIVARITGKVDDQGTPDLNMTGRLPLALSEPFVKPRSVIGTAQFDMALRGGTDLSAVSGQIDVAGARFVDPGSGLVFEDIEAGIGLANGTARISAQARGASGGSLKTDGTVTIDASAVGDLAISIDDLVISDPRLYQTTVGAALSVTGPLTGGALIKGTVTLGETTILVQPSALSTAGSLPNIQHIGEKPASRANRARAGLLLDASTRRASAGRPYRLDVALNIPGRLFVRGRGLDAEMAGNLRIGGTSDAVASTGSINLVRGRLDLLGKRFDLSEGSAGFQGGLDPAIRLVATSATTAGTASIIVEGSASAPEVSFESSPEAPEDEVLAQLFFGRSLSELSAFQTLQLASAVATLAGNKSSDLVGRLRSGLNLDDLDIVTDENGGTAVRAGKYISQNVYTDFTVGNDTGEVTLNLDLNPSLTVKGSVASDGNTGIGVFFGRDY